jgi:hypothetical protein
VAHLRRPPYTKLLPPDAELFTRKGKRFARFHDRQGRIVEAPLSEDGRRVRLRSRVWHGYYRDADGEKCDEALSTDKVAAQQMLAARVKRAEMGRAGIADPFEEQRKRPLREHLAEWEAALLADGDTAKHVRDTVARARRVLDGCKFVFIRDVSASTVQTFLAELKKKGRTRAEVPLGQEKFTKREMVAILGIHPKGVAALLRRHGLDGEGNGKKRR